MTNTAYPVRVTGRLDPGASRGLWLVKWLLLLPHLVVLAVLGLAFWVLTVVAFVAILVTGRYPRVLFGFNVGVLRWGWRVAFYGYAAGGTDRYPPFTLADVPDYPARLDIDYPERLSRGLVLVKWWLLAIPHYLVLVFLIGAGGTVVARIGTTGALGFDGGLVTMLVLIALVAMLFTGSYPRGLFDAVVGMDRWVLRVVAYSSLMTDEYPPFRLDQGGDEPAPPVPPTVPGGPGEAAEIPAESVESRGGAAVLAPPVVPPTVREAPATSVPGGGRSLVLVVGALVTALALGLVGAGLAGTVLDRTGRDAAGLVASGIGSATTAGHALLTEPIRLEAADEPDRIAQLVGEVALRASSISNGEVFVGIAPSAEVARYLDGVATGVWRGAVGSTGTPAGTAGIAETAGGAPTGPPSAQTFWTASAAGPGTQTVIWTPTAGSWTAVVMNADGSAPVAVDVQVGAQVPVLGITSAATWATGLGLLVVGLGVILLGALPRREQAPAGR